MADWHRRAKTSIRRRKTKHIAKTQWTGVLRSIAWPIGEARELALWARIIQWLPCMGILASVFAVAWWATTSYVIFDQDNQTLASRQLWIWFCGDVRVAQTGDVCKTYNWLPGTLGFVACVFSLLFRMVLVVK